MIFGLALVNFPLTYVAPPLVCPTNFRPIAQDGYWFRRDRLGLMLPKNERVAKTFVWGTVLRGARGELRIAARLLRSTTSHVTFRVFGDEAAGALSP